MRQKRDEARAAAEARRQETEARAAESARRKATAEEVITPLRLLGYSAAQARRAAALCEAIPEASLEQRVRRALSYFLPQHRTVAPAAAGLESAP